jgi:WW domain-binding protein 2
VSIDIRPSPDGGLTPGTRSEIRLKNQGLFQLVSLLEKTRERVIYMRRQLRDEEETLRTLTPFPFRCALTVLSAVYASPQGPSRGGGTPVEAPPGYDA